MRSTLGLPGLDALAVDMNATRGHRIWASPRPLKTPRVHGFTPVYARRAVQSPRYSWFDSAHLLSAQERERRVLKALDKNGLSELGAVRIPRFEARNPAAVSDLPDSTSARHHCSATRATTRALVPARVLTNCLGSVALYPLSGYGPQRITRLHQHLSSC